MAYADAIVFSILWSLILLTLLYLFMGVVDGLLAEDIEGPPLEEPSVEEFQQEFFIFFVILVVVIGSLKAFFIQLESGPPGSLDLGSLVLLVPFLVFTFFLISFFINPWARQGFSGK